MRRPLTVLVLVVAAAPGLAPAEVAPPAEPASAETAAPATVQWLAESVVGQVGRLVTDLPRQRIDAAVVLLGELPGEPGGAARLGALVRRLVAGALGRDHGLRSVRVVEAAPAGPWSEAASARQTAGDEGYELLLHGTLTVEQNHLVVAATLLSTDRHLWRDMVEPERDLLGEVFARRRVDAEVRRYLGPVARAEGLRLRSVALPARGYLAVAIADLDGDDRDEVVLLRQRVLEVARLGPAGLSMLATLPLTDLPLAATPSRDPLGSLAVGPEAPDGGRPVALRTSEHAVGLVARFDGTAVRVERRIEDYPLRWTGAELECASVRAGRSAFETEPTPCAGLASTRSVPPYHGYDEARVPRRLGPPAIAASKVLADGRVALRWNGQAAATLSSFGTATAVTDLDDDGVAEVLLSSFRPPGAGDELTVVRLGAPSEGETGRVSLGAVPGSVLVAAAGDPDDDGFRELVAISESGTGSRLLLVE